MTERSKANLLRRLYYNLDSPACFTAAAALLREARRQSGRAAKTMTLGDVKAFLSAQRVYTRHRRVVRRFKRMRIVPAGLHTDWQADLAVMDALSHANDDYRYMLVCVEVLSRRMYVTPARSKRSVDMQAAFERIFRQSNGLLPWKLTTDQGLEFNSRAMLDYFRAKEIRKQCVYTHPIVHAGIVERANRTIKERLFRYMNEKNTNRWIDAIGEIVEAINATPCRSTGVAPNQVTFKNAAALRQRLYGNELCGVWSSSNRHAPVLRFQVGDTVRIEKHKGPFTKGYAPNFTDEIFRIVEIRRTTEPVCYRLADSSGDLVKGWFYAQELCRTHDSEEVYGVERILRTRDTKDGRRELFVKWAGYDSSYNDWIDERDLRSLPEKV